MLGRSSAWRRPSAYRDAVIGPRRLLPVRLPARQARLSSTAGAPPVAMRPLPPSPWPVHGESAAQRKAHRIESVIRERTDCRACGNASADARYEPRRPVHRRGLPERGRGRSLARRAPARAGALRHDPATRTPAACCSCATRSPVRSSTSSYWYRSGINRTMTENLHGIARAVEDAGGLRPGDLVIDIGCNDGTLFDGYPPRDLSLSSGSTPPTSPATRSPRATRSCATSSARARCAERYRRPEGEGHHLDRDVLRPRGPARVRARGRRQPGRATASG